jgi:hypothetical protein
LLAWYKRHLGIDVQVWGGAAFTWTDSEGKPMAGTTIWSIAPEGGDHFAPSTAPFMINYRVEDLRALVKVLKEEGCNLEITQLEGAAIMSLALLEANGIPVHVRGGGFGSPHPGILVPEEALKDAVALLDSLES